MTIRVGASIIPDRIVCGFRGHGVLGSALAHGGAYDGLLFKALGGAPDPSKEYWFFIPSVPAGLTNIQSDGSFDYAGTSVAFVFDVHEGGVLLGHPTASMLIDGLPAPGSDPDSDGKSVSITLESRVGVLRTNVANINWFCADVRGIVLSSGVSSTNDAGLFSVSVNSNRDVGEKVLLWLDNYDGTNDDSYFAFFGPVTLS
ncbi:MAG: hypothetical protein ABIT83_17510 [Massilia sp.]